MWWLNYLKSIFIANTGKHFICFWIIESYVFLLRLNLTENPYDNDPIRWRKKNRWRKKRHKIQSELTNGEWSTAKLWQRTHQFTIEHFVFSCYQLLNQICICNVCVLHWFCFVLFAAGVELWNIQLRFNFNCIWIFMTNHCIIIRIAFMVYFNQVKISGECTWVHNLAARCARIHFVSIKF